METDYAMIGILVWLAVAIFTAWEITVHRLWHDGLAACAVVAFVLWVVGGAAFISARPRIPYRKAKADADAERVAMQAELNAHAERARKGQPAP